MRILRLRSGGFSLVELLLVIVITGILGALLLLNASSSEKVDAQVEAKRIVRSLHSLRTAWLSYNSDKFEMLGVPSYNISTDSAIVTKSLELYMSTRKLDEETARYGSIDIQTVNGTGGDRVYLGFNSKGDFGGSDMLKTSVPGILSGMSADYGIVGAAGGAYVQGGSIMIRIK
ncbi:MAG: type II secretion system GspH family protein [Synergistaceae bacterium]|jgi:prepilin-type N-terminal cleavage/methylation domain-containing protein|nr:type II secretion system GspH family protein [Synergistaceae bacterium]